VGFLQNAFTALARVAGAPAFSVSVDPGVLYGVPTLDDYILGSRRVPRALALSVPAVKRARDIIAGSIGGLVMELVDATGAPLAGGWSLLDQPEPDRAASVTWTEVAEDLLFDALAVLVVTHVGWHGKPAEIRRGDPATYTARPEQRVMRTATGASISVQVWAPDTLVIRIESPNPALLTTGAQAIRTCVALAAMTSLHAHGLPPATYFTPKDGVDTLTPDEIQTLLDAWFQARSKNVTGYVPGALELKALGWNPEQLQMTEMRKDAVLDIARLTGVDAEELSVSTTSRTYFNAWDRKQDFIQFVIGPYLTAIAGRLSMDDVTPRGYTVRHKLDDFYKADTLARYQAYAVGLPTGAITLDEIRVAEKKPSLTAAEIADVAARRAPVPTTDPASQETADA